MARVLVTGGAGVIGRHLGERLVRRGSEVVIVDNLKRSARSLVAPLVAGGGVRFIEGDIRDSALLTSAMSGCEVAYHLAAQSNVMGAADDPDYSIGTNVLGTFRV